jgi:hypothetical protein
MNSAWRFQTPGQVSMGLADTETGGPQAKGTGAPERITAGKRADRGMVMADEQRLSESSGEEFDRANH